MHRKQIYFITSIMFVAFISIGLFSFASNPTLAVAAQSTGDRLPTRTPTATASPSPTSTPKPKATSTPTPAPKVWTGRIVDNILGYTKGEGSIFRVHVQGVADTLIELRSDDQLITANSGSKLEYGPFAAEFAPVTEGVWTVSVPALNVNLDVRADNYNLVIVEFVQVPVTEATPAPSSTATATPLGGHSWQGYLTNETIAPGVPFARLLVRVEGRDHHPVQLSTVAQVINTANTGQKPNELGPNTVEFTGLTPGKYIVEPLGLNARLEVELKPNVETRVEFKAVPPTATPISTATATRIPKPASPTATAPPTFTPTPTPTATFTVTPSPTPTFTPLPSPTSVVRWLGMIESRTDAGVGTGAIQVRVAGIEGLPVQLYSLGNQFVDKRCITGQGGLGQDVCALKDLTPNQYFITPEGLDVTLPVTIFENETVVVNFDTESLPPGISGWQARLLNSTTGYQAYPKWESTIRVRVVGREGLVIALIAARTPATVRYCEARYNPVRGGPVCEFGQLGPGVYQIEALNTGASLKIYVDGVGKAEVEFAPNATNASSLQLQPMVGQGAQPRLPTATATATKMPMPMFMPTVTPPPTFTPTPAFAWQGRIVESTFIGSGAIGVRAAGLKDHPVILRSGDWQSHPQLTGTKNELGLYAAEFAGLGPGEYIIELVDIAELKVNLQPGEFILVEFRYDFVNPP